MKKRFILLLIIIAFICFGCFYLYDYSKDVAVKKSEDLLKVVTKRGYIIVGVNDDIKPFGFIENGKNTGFDIDIAHRIAKDIFHDEEKVKFVPVAYKDRLYTLNINKVDMIIATMSITPQRMSFADFSKSYYVTGQSLLVRAGSNIKSLADLSDKNVGVIFGSTAEQTLKLLLPTARVHGYRAYKDAYDALKAGKILGVVADDSILRNFALNDGSVKILPKKYSKELYGVAFRKGAESANLLNSVNNTITQMDSQNELIQLIRKWKLD